MIDLPKWIDDAPDQRARDFRTPVLVILHSIASAPTLRQCMTIKEGILLAIGFDSPRFTKDIDFSTDQKLQSLSLDETKKTLDHQLALAPDQLGVDLALAVQSCKLIPQNKPNASFDSMQFTIGYAKRGTRQHKRLLLKQSSTTISIDF